MTAAHCLYDDDNEEVLPASSFSVMLGLHDRGKTTELKRLLFDYPYNNFYRTHVHMGSDHWVAMSVRNSKSFLKPCEDLVKTVNVVNVVKI